MYDLKIDKGGKVLDLAHAKNYEVYKIDGLGPVSASITQTTNTTFAGSVINSAKVGSRNIVLYISISGDIEENRLNLYNYFEPTQEVTLYFKNKRRNVYIKGIVETFLSDFYSEQQIAQISIICPEPYFKNVTALELDFSRVTKGFEFPFSIPKSGIALSNLSYDPRIAFENTGDIETGVIINLKANGTVTSPAIYDVLTKKHIKLNFTMQAYDVIVINTNVNQKSIKLFRDGKESNLLGKLVPTSSWLSLKAGDNVYTYEAESSASNLSVALEANEQFGGL